MKDLKVQHCSNLSGPAKTRHTLHHLQRSIIFTFHISPVSEHILSTYYLFMLADLERELLSIDREEKKLIKEIKDAAK